MIKHKKINIGVFSGGGSKGLISLQIAKEIEKKLKNKSIIDTLDAISGTSTGAIISCFLALRKSNDPKSPDYMQTKYSVDDIIELYNNSLPEIFGPKQVGIFQLLKNPFSKISWKKLDKGVFFTDALQKMLKKEIGDIDFTTDNFLVPVTIPVSDIKNRKSIVFRTEDNLPNKVMDIILATSAIVPFLPSYTNDFYIKEHGKVIKKHLTLCDGCFYANTFDLDMVAHYLSINNPVICKDGKKYINKNCKSVIKITEFGTGSFVNLISVKKGLAGFKDLVEAMSTMLTSFSDRSRHLIDEIFEAMNSRNKNPKHHHRHIVINDDFLDFLSYGYSSKKDLNKLCKAGTKIANKCSKEIDEYIKDFK